MTNACALDGKHLASNRGLALDSIDVEATVFTWPVRVYWEDTDAGGIVFYANYLKFFERARSEWLRQLGLGQHALREEVGGMFVVTDAQLKYHRSARLDDLLQVSARITQSGAASLTMHQQAWLAPAPAVAVQPANATPAKPGLLCEATVRLGWLHAATMRPTRIPASVAQAFASARAAHPFNPTPPLSNP